MQEITDQYGRDTMLFITLLIIATDTGFEHLQSPFTGGHFYDVEKVDTIVYIANLRGFDIYRWHTTNPQLIARVSTDGLAYGIDVSDEYAYIADYYKGLCIFDIANPTSPALVGGCEIAGKASDVVVHNQYAYLADWSGRLVIVDISDPSAPFLVGQCSNMGEAFSVTLKDTLAYVGVFDNPLKIVNVADPSNPFVIAEYPPAGIYGLDIVIDDTLAYVNCWRDIYDPVHFHVVNIKDPANPFFVAGVEMPYTNRGIEKSGNYVYTSAQNDGVYIIDVTDPAAPFVAGYYYGSYRFGYGYAICDSLLIATHFFDGFSIADVSEPQNPIKLYHHQNVIWKYFAWNDSLKYLYVVGDIVDDRYFHYSTLKILDISDPANPSVCGSLGFLGRAYLFEGSIDHPYLAVTISRHPGLFANLYTAVIDVSDPYAPEVIRFAEGGGVTEMHVPHLYALNETQIKIADMNQPFFWVDSITLPNVGRDIVVRDTIAYVAADNFLVILDMNTGNYIASCYHGRPYARNISLDFPYLAIPYTPYPGSTYGFLLFDVTHPSSPTVLFDTLIYAPPVHPESYTIMGCELRDTLLLLGRGDYGFDLWKIKLPDSIYRISTQETPYLATHSTPGGNSNIHADGNVIFLIDNGSLEIYRLIQPGVEENNYAHYGVSGLSIRVSPSPFRMNTNIRCNLEESSLIARGDVSLEIFDASGRRVNAFSLSGYSFPASITWDGTDNEGTELSQGVYFVRLNAGSKSSTTKVVLIK